ncbi:hypothetical protein CspeluHIS016_0700760 [Cutaneotrichosporon spelunceum]|uniref:Transglutaminase-like domain-containing protein n=1 Tax=Cutaneotrichosporon spelunceum TaxID=1672016 RepID=A0AAD3YDF4_9TREE|nr:hypothetical protein CspeluHIS016_0700760 [Cutaneotrichosporon spelunceum]
MPAGAIESGYVAHQLLAGVYDGIPSLDPTAEDVAHAREMLGLLQGALARLWALSDSLRGRVPGRMDGVFVSLKKHSWETDAHLNPNRDEIDRTLEHLPERAEALLATAQALEKGEEAQEDTERFSGLLPGFGYEDALVLATARWFKHEYFRWADPIKCTCGGDTEFSGQGQPNEEDLEGGAGRVELHKCKVCGEVTRFPRYNTTKALMRARVGRCGEFAQLFYIFLLALGLEARYVWNSEDHVWTEYWSPSLQHWVHADSCEAEINKPLLYDRGWGKMQAYCLAFGASGAEDVTRVYVDDWAACLRRREDKWRQGTGWDEKRLAWLLLAHTVQCRGLDDEEERLRLQSMDEAQARWVADEARRFHEAEASGLKGRRSGTEEWKEARGETGK